MANKIISFADNNLTQAQKRGLDPVYLDISMISRYIPPYIIENQPESEYLAYLGGENKVPVYILTEDGKKILLQYAYNKNPEINAQNAANKLKKYVIDNLKDIYAVQNSLHNIFSWIPGERILNPEFGSNLRRLLYNGITEFNKEQIAAEVRACVTKWEPRVQIDKIVDLGTVDDDENNTVHLEIVYSIPGLTDSQQYVYDYQYNRSE